MQDYLLVLLVVISLGFLVLGFMRKGLIFYGLAGLLLMGSGFFLQQEGLEVVNGSVVSYNDSGDINGITDTYLVHSAASYPVINIGAYSLQGIGLLLVLWMFVGLRSG